MWDKCERRPVSGSEQFSAPGAGREPTWPDPGSNGPESLSDKCSYAHYRESRQEKSILRNSTKDKITLERFYLTSNNWWW